VTSSLVARLTPRPLRADYSGMTAITTTRSEVVVARARVESDGRVLLVRRAAGDSMPGHWELPGGKVDGDERVPEALAREVAEETGLMLVGVRVASKRWLVSPSGRWVREHLYDAAASGSVLLSDEHDAYAWVEDPRSLPLTDSAAAAFAAA
jgi:8-oxo-dGTP pyrophosphatase MutT (NUDIX family)